MGGERLTEDPAHRFVEFIHRRRQLNDEYFQDIAASRIFLDVLGGEPLRLFPIPPQARLIGGYLPTERQIVLQSIDRSHQPLREVIRGTYQLREILELDTTGRGRVFWQRVARADGTINDICYERKPPTRKQSDIYVGIRFVKGKAFYDVQFKPPQIQLFDWLDIVEGRVFSFEEFPDALKGVARWQKKVVTVVLVQKIAPEYAKGGNERDIRDVD